MLWRLGYRLGECRCGRTPAGSRLTKREAASAARTHPTGGPERKRTMSMPSFGDLLYAFTEWLRTTQLVELSLWISNTPLSLMIQENFWAIPTIQTIHILAIAGLFGSALMMNLRVLGLTGGGRTIAETAGRYMPWVWWGLLFLVVTGILMVIGEPVRELINPVFWIKMVLVLLAVLLTLGFHRGLRRAMAEGEAMREVGVGMRVGAAGIILLWCTIMVAGRWIAYAPV
jgi:hypothetical protein